MRISYLLIVLCNVFNPSNQFNLDLKSCKQHFGNQNSMFGFSVAVHKYYNKNWVLVGAPKDNVNLGGVNNTGAVYRCDIHETNRCTLIPFDSKGNSYNDRNERVDNKDGQWLGATLTSAGENGPVVACAPRYVFHTMQPSNIFRIEPVGTCFTANQNLTIFTEYSPCRTNDWGYHRQGSCQAGFSAAISKTGNRLFIGAPGSWYWQGQVYSIHTDAKFPFKPPIFHEFGSGGQTYSFDVMDPRTTVYSTRESYLTDDDSYLGYSMISGDFNGDGEDDIAVGMPRGAGLLGKIVIYKLTMINIYNITGKQIGAYFGYSICTSDIDGDKLDDLIIGAPMYTDTNNEGKYDVGRIYVMLQKNNKKFETILVRDGLHSKSRFGTAVTTLGDINRDGYGDFAVGAPYDGKFHHGAVYIFHGSKDGPLEKYSQVIYAEDLNTNYLLRTFGFSLAGGLDLDGNLYPDLVVGAYDTNTVFVFRSRPVAVIDASTNFISSNKILNLENKKCVSRRDGKKLVCAEIQSCLKYDGTNLPLHLEITVTWLLDAKSPKSPRMFFLQNENRNIQTVHFQLEYGKRFCNNQTVYIINNIRDKLTPLEVEMRYNLRENFGQPNFTRGRRSVLSPIMDQNREIVQRDSLSIQKNCGPDNICIPNLELTVKTLDKFLLGSKEALEIEVLIKNKGEDAFETGFYMNTPSELDFKKVRQLGDPKDVPLTCTAPTAKTNFTLKCDVGNPFQAGKIARFMVLMLPSQKTKVSPSYEFFMEVNSTNPEKSEDKMDNVVRKIISVWVDTNISVKGLSYPDFDHYTASNYKEIENSVSENDLGPHLVHIYNIINDGPSEVNEVVLSIYWPYQTLANKTLMYLLNPPEIYGNIVCEPNTLINYRHLEFDASLASKSYLELAGVIAKSVSKVNTNEFHVEHTFTSNSKDEHYITMDFLTEDEKQNILEDENAESVGDASLLQKHRSELAVETKHHQSNAAQTSIASQAENTVVPSEVSAVQNITYLSNNRENENVKGASNEFLYNINENQARNIYNSYDTNKPGKYRSSAISLSMDNKNNLNVDPYKNNYYKKTIDNFPKGSITNNYENHPAKYLIQRKTHQGNNFEKENDYRRYKRETKNTKKFPAICEDVICGKLNCIIRNLGKDDEAWIAVRARLVAKTLEQLGENIPINISTYAGAEVTQIPYVGKPKETIIKGHEIFFKAIPEPIGPPNVVPLWVVVLSASAGAIIFLLIVFLLHKCGFFKRNRPTSNFQERQPLNSRSEYHGDEHL